MGFYAEDDSSSSSSSISGLTISQAIYEAALIIAVLRWILCFVFKIMKDKRTRSCSSSCCSRQMLPLSSFGEIIERLPETEDTCAVCLNQMRMEDEVRELMNCYHVFHRECIDKWLEHGHENENHNSTCPLCRAPLLTSCYSLSSETEISTCVPPTQPSWAVERLLYLFGDDHLLPS